MLRNISPHAIAHASFCKPHDLRLWRSQGFLDGVGERQGKGHLYSIADAIQIKASILLARCRIPYRDAFEVIGKYRKQIETLCSHNRASTKSLVLIIKMKPTFDDRLSLIGGDVPVARVVFDEAWLAEVSVNLSALAAEIIQRVNAYQARHAA